MALSRYDRHILGYNPLIYLRPNPTALADLSAFGVGVTTPLPLTASSISDEFERGTNGTPVLAGNGTTLYSALAAMPNLLTRLNGRPFTVGARYYTTQTTRGQIFYQGGPGGTQHLAVRHNCTYDSSDGSNHCSIEMTGVSGANYRVFGGYHGGLSADGQPHSHVWVVDPAVASGSGPCEYYFEAVKSAASNNNDWDGAGAYSPTVEATEGSVLCRKVGASTDMFLAAGLIEFWIIPTNLQRAQIEWMERLRHGLDRPTRFESRVANILPRDTGDCAAIKISGDSQATLASGGSGDQLRAWGVLRGAQQGARRIAPIAASRLMLARDALGVGWENGADGISGSACTPFNTAVPSEISDNYPHNSGVGKLAYLANQIAWLGSGTVAASGGALVEHLLQDFPHRADEGIECRFMTVGLKATPGSVTAEIVNKATGTILATATVTVGGAVVSDSNFAWQSANYWASWSSVTLAAGAAIPNQINGTTPQLLIRFRGTGPCGVVTYRTISVQNPLGLSASVFEAAGGTKTREHVELLYDTLSETQLANVIAADTEWMTRTGRPGKLLIPLELGTNDPNDTTASRNPDGTTNGSNPAGSTIPGQMNNMLAIVNRYKAAMTLLGRSHALLGFVFNMTQDWNDFSRMTRCSAGMLRMLRDNPSVNGIFVDGELVCPYGLGVDRSWYYNAPSDKHKDRSGNLEIGVYGWHTIARAVEDIRIGRGGGCLSLGL